ncbi:CRISPR-associated helicase Cas3' [Paenibacillus thiaminolyticus]|uniref:CRISPR-associated helicase Cas3' n=1 Tax=Paenibacillus thiaminolyticus TaxID=49283 RepID=UPI003D29C8FE
MEFYAHTHDIEEWQPLKKHLENVANLSKQHAEVFGAGYLGYLSGILHDIGKYSADFQKRIRGSNIRVDHSTAGAQWISRPEVYREQLGTMGIHKLMARLIAYIISGHHGGLRNYGALDEEGTLCHRLAKRDVPDWVNAWSEIALGVPQPMNIRALDPALVTPDCLAWKYSFFGRMLYSCLVDADTIDTRNFCNREVKHLLGSRRVPTIPQLWERHSNFMSKKLSEAEDTLINDRRRQILAACQRQAEREPGIFSLSVPTGGGKTLSSMSFALKHVIKNRVEYGLRRIIYVVPFTSIIEQSAQQFRDSLGQEAVLEHHSNFDYEEYEEHHGPEEASRLKLYAENWDAPIVITTSVQFFESLFSNARSKCRKLHNIAKSVIIIDEVQSIPRGFLKPSLHALQELVQSYGCSVVLCTATQPSWKHFGLKVQEMMDDPGPKQLQEEFRRRRVQVSVHGSSTGAVPDARIVEWMEHTTQGLCIVNTRKHARILYDRLKLRVHEGVYHLSGTMCAKHRSDILDRIRARLNDKLPCRVVSTQLIEAGVDIDFPVVMRSLAGLDSIAQAAGRCNREGKLAAGKVYVFYPEKHGMPMSGWMKESASEAEHVIKYSGEAPLSLAAIEQYFERIHGIRDGRVAQVTDAKGIMSLLEQKNRNLEIPYQEIADRFRFINESTRTIVVPYTGLRGKTNEVNKLIKRLAVTRDPGAVLRQLQPYTVQVYPQELTKMQHLNMLDNINGILYLTNPNAYSVETGLVQPGE